MYSKYDDITTNGAVQCVVEPANPLPKLAGGPTAGLDLATQLKLLAPDSFARLLPLPTFHFNAKNNASHVDEKELRAYTRRLAYPLDLASIVGNVSELLAAASGVE
jgi:hypothetical protein